MTSIHKIAGASAVALVLMTGAGLARDGAARGAGLFERFDSDGDGEITRAEFDALRADRFAGADADGDGLLTSAELVAAAMARNTEAAIAERVNLMIGRLDRDGDKALSADELPGDRGARIFERIDADGDGVVTRAEAAAMRDHRGRGRFGRHGRDG